MTTSHDQWLARCAVAACISSRWMTGASLALAFVAMSALFFLQLQPAMQVAFGVATATGAAQAYLAARIEFERVIFHALVFATDTAAAASGYDAAAREAGLVSGEKAGQDVARRVKSLMALVNANFFAFLFQLAVLVTAGWLAR
jgi:hypothetical protein